MPVVLADWWFFSSVRVWGMPPLPYVPGPGVAFCAARFIKLS